MVKAVHGDWVATSSGLLGVVVGQGDAKRMRGEDMTGECVDYWQHVEQVHVDTVPLRG